MAASERPLARVGRIDGVLARRVAAVARAAAGAGIEVYLVGGPVRDLLLGRASPDLDFVAIGDGFALAGLVQQELGGRLVLHRDFLTADLIDAAGVHLDIATARRERYTAVAALPAVEPAGLADDLRRRDFTVNTLALALDGAGWRERAAAAGAAGDGPQTAAGWQAAGSLDAIESVELDLGAVVDLYGGRDDLAAGVLRVLHQRSFLDDPTRVLRAVRFEVRLGLRMADGTEALARQALAAGAFGQLTGGRLRHELEILLGGDAGQAIAGVERLDELGVLRAVQPDLALDGGGRRRLQAAAIELAWYRAATGGAAAVGPAAGGAAAAAGTPALRRWLVVLAALLSGLDLPRRRQAALRLLLAGEELRLAASEGGRPHAAAAALAGTGEGEGEITAGQVDAALAPLAPEELILLAALGDAGARAWVRRYVAELRPFRLGVGGAELLAAGARPGPAIGAALRATRAARLNGEIGAADELAFALACTMERGDLPTP